MFRTVAPEKLQLALNASEVRFAKQQVAESVTGQKIGNISPIFTGEVMKTGLVTVIDANLLPGSAALNTSDGIDEQDFVYAGVGVDGWELKLLLKDLLSAGSKLLHYKCVQSITYLSLTSMLLLLLLLL